MKIFNSWRSPIRMFTVVSLLGCINILQKWRHKFVLLGCGSLAWTKKGVCLWTSWKCRRSTQGLRLCCCRYKEDIWHISLQMRKNKRLDMVFVNNLIGKSCLNFYRMVRSFLTISWVVRSLFRSWRISVVNATPQLSFSDIFHDPFYAVSLLNILSCPPPEADDHSISAGYEVVFLQLWAVDLWQTSLYLTEHGFATRERGKLLCQRSGFYLQCASWWIYRFFYMLSDAIYQKMLKKLPASLGPGIHWDGLWSEKMSGYFRSRVDYDAFSQIPLERTRWLDWYRSRGSIGSSGDIKTYVVLTLTRPKPASCQTFVCTS